MKGGDTGLNLSLADLFGKRLQLPSLRSIVWSFFTNKPIEVEIKGYPVAMIKRLELIQKLFDDEVMSEMEKAKRGM